MLKLKMEINGKDILDAIKRKHMCTTCLRTTNSLYPMSFACKNVKSKLVTMLMPDNQEIMVCSICRWQFRRWQMFEQQCQAASNILNNAHMNANETFDHHELNCLNLISTKTEIHSFSGNIKNEPINDLTYSPMNNPPVNDALMNMKSEMNGLDLNNGVLSYLNHLEVNGSSVNMNQHTNGSSGNMNQQTNGSSVNTKSVYNDEDSDFNNDDEVPLVLLRQQDRRKRKKILKTQNKHGQVMHEMASRKYLKSLTSSNGEIHSEQTKETSRKIPKKLKEGFSSRMVQETDEYEVIKLTKEQVLSEMQARSHTEAYVQSPYKCVACVRGFNFIDVLNKHMEKHTKDNGAFKCEMCSQYCPSAVSLRGHLKSHTTRYKCKLCGVVRLSRQHLLEHHSITHTLSPNRYSCDTCQFNTNKRTVMQRHVRTHASSQAHACDKCGKLFKTIDSLRVHTIRHDKSSRVQCPRCVISFVYHSQLRRHIASVHDARDYYCVECDVHFKSNESLRLHFKKAKRHRDASSNIHSCPLCPQRLYSAASLAAHQATAHGAARDHACRLCERKYSTRDALRAHVWRLHRLSEKQGSTA